MLQGDIGHAAKELMIQVAAEKGVNLIECESMVDHVHLLVEVADRSELSRVMNLLKGATSRRLFEQFPDLRLDAGIHNFWQHRYAAEQVDAGAKGVVRRYIRTQERRLEKYERV